MPVPLPLGRLRGLRHTAYGDDFSDAQADLSGSVLIWLCAETDPDDGRDVVWKVADQ
jgi:hypothetical protein